jgi:hypothetical protein
MFETTSSTRELVMTGENWAAEGGGRAEIGVASAVAVSLVLC